MTIDMYKYSLKYSTKKEDVIWFNLKFYICCRCYTLNTENDGTDEFIFYCGSVQGITE